MKYYHMIIEPENLAPENARKQRREYISRAQGSAPRGWRCVGVCGYHETPRENEMEGNENE